MPNITVTLLNRLNQKMIKKKLMLVFVQASFEGNTLLAIFKQLNLQSNGVKLSETIMKRLPQQVAWNTYLSELRSVLREGG